MSRRQRQRDQLGQLCRSERVGRAVDLAFEHLAEFGRDEEVLELLGRAVERPEVPDDVRRRFAELDEARPR